MNDYSGRPLKEGDSVIFIMGSYRCFKTGVITKVNEKKLTITCGGEINIRDSRDVIKYPLRFGQTYCILMGIQDSELFSCQDDELAAKLIKERYEQSIQKS
jgi:ribosomal protein L24